jgi:hypothetical protein
MLNSSLRSAGGRASDALTVERRTRDVSVCWRGRQLWAEATEEHGAPDTGVRLLPHQWTRLLRVQAFSTLSGLRLLHHRTRGLTASDASGVHKIDRWFFELARRVALRGASDAAARVCCVGIRRVWCPRSGCCEKANGSICLRAYKYEHGRPLGCSFVDLNTWVILWAREHSLHSSPCLVAYSSEIEWDSSALLGDLYLVALDLWVGCSFLVTLGCFPTS